MVIHQQYSGSLGMSLHAEAGDYAKVGAGDYCQN